MTPLCEGRVAIITGAGRGIGRAEALEFARQGATVVVNDLGSSLAGEEASSEPAESVASEIRELGGRAIANADDVSDWDGAKRLIDCAIEEFGDIHILVNNAGILRDRMLVNMSAEEWDAVVRVHLRGSFCTIRHAAAYWRDVSKSGGHPKASIINTSSASGLYGYTGQSNYGAAKAGIASLTVIAAMELQRYEVTVNAIAPAALTRMTEALPYAESARELRDKDPVAFNDLAPENVAPLVAWLGGHKSRNVTGRVFNIRGGEISVAENWQIGPGLDIKARWTPEQLDDVLPDLLRRSRGNVRI
jgi:NAD(P)-dependent dehydrogenase (short-subunit alcohol dehydrogenase family)